MKIFSDEWWLRRGVKTISVNCPERLLSKTEIQDLRVLKRSQQDWWAIEDRGGYTTCVFDCDEKQDADYPHTNYDYATDDLNNFEYVQDQYI